MSATSARTLKKGVNIWPQESMTVAFQFHSVEARAEVSGTPRTPQLLRLMTAGSAVWAHRAPFTAACEIASKLAASRERLIRLLRKLSSPPKIGLLNT